MSVVVFSLQVWKYPKVWEGFVKCCQRTKPQSYSVLLQLPPAQLTSVFERCPELRGPLLQHVHSFTPHQVRDSSESITSALWFPACTNCFIIIIIILFLTQQAHIPASIMVVLEGEKKPEPTPVEPTAEKEVTDEDREFLTVKAHAEILIWRLAAINLCFYLL